MSETRSAPRGTVFVGVGTMGGPMAGNLRREVGSLVVYDADAGRGAAVAEEIDAMAAPDLGQAVATADIVVLMLPSSAIVESVLLGVAGAGGILERMPPESLVIDMSSSVPASTIALAKAAQERGVTLVDAPVSGGVRRAATADLAIMVGGDHAAVERATPLLRAMGSTVVHTGAAGSAHAMKALNNLLSATGLAAASEVLAVGRRFGLEPATMLEVLNASSGRNHATENKVAQFVLSRSFDAGFSLHLMVKDLRIALGMAHDAQVPVPISASAFETWSGARAMLGDGAVDHTEVAKFVERNAGVTLGHDPDTSIP